MARIRIPFALVADSIFGHAAGPVRVLRVTADPAAGILEFQIEGPDVPDAEEVTGLCHVQQNRAGQRLTTMTFEPVERPAPPVRDLHFSVRSDAHVAELLEQHGETIRKWLRGQIRNGAIA